MNTYIYSVGGYNGIRGTMYVEAFTKDDAEKYMLIMLHDTSHFRFIRKK